jgi:hypothetical protein
MRPRRASGGRPTHPRQILAPGGVRAFADTVSHAVNDRMKRHRAPLKISVAQILADIVSANNLRFKAKTCFLCGYFEAFPAAVKKKSRPRLPWQFPQSTSDLRQI